MAQTASVRLTLSNIATEEDVNNLREDLTHMEERIMSALSDAIAALRETVNNLSVAQSPERVSELESLLAAERLAASNLAASEEAEDVEQNAALVEARSATDSLLAEMNSAAGELGTITAQLAAVGTAVDEAPDETPVGEVPVEAPAPTEPSAPVDSGVEDPGVPAEAPVEETPAEAPVSEEPSGPTTDAPSSPETTDGVDSDAGTPAPDAAPAAPAGGPVDASGNPVDGPRL